MAECKCFAFGAVEIDCPDTHFIDWTQAGLCYECGRIKDIQKLVLRPRPERIKDHVKL